MGFNIKSNIQLHSGTKWWVFNQSFAATFSFALVQTVFQHTLPTNLGGKNGRMSAALFSQSFFFGGSKEMQLKGALVFQLQQQQKANEMRRKSELQHSRISATGKLACLSSFAPVQCLSPRQHCSHRLWKDRKHSKKECPSCHGLEGKSPCKWKKEKKFCLCSHLCSHFWTPTVQHLG